ncbi:MAG: polysaccharide biosynthesis C-terminal domain-containing protein [Elusimicrobiota bacterium]
MAIAPTRRRIGLNFFWKSAAEGSRALQALYFILLARRLGSSELGRFSVGFSAAMILATVGDFGLNTLLTRQVATDRSNGTAVFLQTAYLKAIFFAVLFIGAAIWPGLDGRRVYVLLFLGIAAGRNIIDQLSYFCLAYEKLVIEAQMKFLLGFFSLALAWLALGLRPGANAAAAALLAAELLAAAAGSALVARHLVSLPRPERWPKLGWPVSDAKELLAMTLIGVALAGFSRIDISCLNWMNVASSDIGSYFAAERIIATVCLLPGLLAISALPIFSKHDDAGHAVAVNRLRLELFLAGCAAAAALNVFGARLTPLIYGSHYGDASRPLSWLALALPFMFVNHFSLIALIAAKRSWHAAFAASAAFALNVLADWQLIPRMGIFGAAAGAILAQLTVSVIVSIFLLNSRALPLKRPLLAEPPL